ncbi:hypothetical protein OG234_13495 [Streptomyces sp. NBC_01420]|uniref:hypothetical protein n=1 Tax=Streptomyces sp. NBC_01420 TaxID=2903858 RepID=UPI003248C3F9
MRLCCLACPAPRAAGTYLCPTCWSRLPDPTRRKLNRRDHNAFARLRELTAAIQAGTPLHQITVSNNELRRHLATADSDRGENPFGWSDLPDPDQEKTP